jgi:hypothetical protein
MNSIWNKLAFCYSYTNISCKTYEELLQLLTFGLYIDTILILPQST